MRKMREAAMGRVMGAGALIRATSVAALLALAGLTACRSAEPSIQGLTAFVGASVLPMTSEVVVPDQTVVIADGMILEAGPTDEVEVPPGAAVIDGAGRYLMPGLAEMHAHVPPGDDPPREDVDEIMFLYLANGITTIRGMLGSAYQIPLADEIESGDALGPTFYVGAPSINGSSAPAPENAERLVRAHVEAGYDLQKIHPGVSRETWDRMAEVAGELGITFAGHVPADVGLVRAIETGMSTVDHLDGYVQAVAPADVQAQVNAGQINLEGLAAEGIDEARLEEMVRLTIEHEVYVVPTMYLWANLYGSPDPDAMLMQPEMKYVSPQTRESWRRRAEGGGRGSPEGVAAFLEARNQILKALSDAGAGILMGTDSPQLFNVPGFALHRELRVMSEAGMSNYEILKSGTAVVGEYVESHLGLDGNFGTIERGQRADLVLLESNPLDDLANLTDRVGVMVRGRWLSQEEIEAGLKGIAGRHGGGE